MTPATEYRILHLCSEKGWRGGEQQVAYLVKELSKMGAVSIVGLKKDSFLERYCTSNGIHSYQVRFSNSVDLYSAGQVARICKKERIDLIHTHTSVAHGVGVISTLFGNRVPVLMSRRVDFVPHNNFLTRWKYMHSSIKLIVGVSDEITGIMKRYVRDPEKCITIYDGVDAHRFRPLGAEPNALRREFHVHPAKTVIGNTSALADHKDYFTFIDTIATLSQRGRDVQGFIVGGGPLDEKLRTYVLRKGLQHLITFTGFRMDVTALLPCFDVFLMSSKQEGLGSSILDAFNADVPVVATNAGGIPELVIDNETGLLAPVGDSSKLADRIEQILDDMALRSCLVTTARNLAASFTNERMARDTLDAYRRILEK
jgi:L-malate glycosyltransferase